jgi:hypothetical protein
LSVRHARYVPGSGASCSVHPAKSEFRDTKSQTRRNALAVIKLSLYIGNIAVQFTFQGNIIMNATNRFPAAVFALAMTTATLAGAVWLTSSAAESIRIDVAVEQASRSQMVVSKDTTKIVVTQRSADVLAKLGVAVRG